MFQYVAHDAADAFRGSQRTLSVDIAHLLILDVLLFAHGADIIHPERQYVAVGNGIHDGVDVQLLAESLFRGFQIELAACPCVYREYGRARKAEKMVTLEFLDDGGVHIPELAAVALVKDEHDVLAIDLVRAVLTDKYRQLLYGGDDDACLRVFQLAFQYGGAGVAVCRPFLEAVIFFHGLVIQVLAVNYEQHFVNVLHAACQACRLERGECLAAARSVPHVAATFYGAVFLVVGRNADLLQDAFRCGYLVRTHHEQQFFRCQHAIFCQDVEQRVLGKECGGEIHEVGDYLVVPRCPKARKLEAVAGLLFPLLVAPFACLGYVRGTGGVAVILRLRAVADYEQLHVLKQSTSCPEALAVVAVDLVERFLDVHAPAFQLHVDERQAVHEDGHVVAVFPHTTLRRILVDYL